MKLIMKMMICALILASIVLLAGCQGSGKEITCDKPYITSESACCLDQDSNNVCDDDEKAAESQPSTPDADTATQESPQEETAEEEVNLAANESQSETESSLDIKIEEAGEVEDFLEVFRGKKTQIIFGQEAGAPLVAATINLLAYYGNPYNMDYSMITPDASIAGLPAPINLILLGNGCDNNYIREILSLTKEGCMGSLGDEKGIVKILKANDKYVLMIMAKEDASVHSMVNSLVKGEIEASSNEVEVDLP